MMGKTTAHIRKQKGRPSSFFFSILLLVLLGAGSLLPVSAHAEDQDFANLNRALSLAYTEMLFQEESGMSYPEILDSALVFWPRNPDALYYKALSLMEEKEYDQAVSLLTGALSGVPLKFSDRDEVRRLYLELLVNHDRSDLALTVFSGMIPQKMQQQQFLELKARALKNSGYLPTLMEVVEAGTGLFPENDFFRSLRVKYSSSERNRIRKRILGEPEKKLYGRGTLQELIGGTVLPAQLNKLLEIYRNFWGEDIFYRVHSLRASSIVTGDDLKGLFEAVDSIPGEMLEIIHRSVLEKSGDGAQELFQEAFGNYNGRVLRDPDGDGLFEVTEHYENGLISRLEANLDGDPELELETDFKFGRPSKVTVLGMEGSYFEAEYRVYPELSVVRLPSEREGVLEIKAAPFSLYYPFEGFDRFTVPKPVPLPRGEDFPALYRLLSNAATVESQVDREVAVRFSRERKRIERYRNGLVEMQVDLDMAVLEERKKDPDGDGFFEIREYYRNGVLYRIVFDGNENGLYEYVEEFEPEHVRKWDTNEDGIADYYEK